MMRRTISTTIVALAVGIGLLPLGCTQLAPSTRQSAGENIASDHSMQAIRELHTKLSAAIASIEEHNTAGNDIIMNDPWMIGVVGILLVLSPYVFGKAVWLVVGRVIRSLTTQTTLFGKTA